MNHINRILNLTLIESYSVFLCGARKTGKSTYLKTRWPEAIYIDFLKSDIMDRYLMRPHLLREELLLKKDTIHKQPVILDEVQKVPRILDEVHWMIENIPGIQFILCGSSVRKLKQSGSNLLGGRALRYMFLPFCYPELEELNWERICNNGLLPSHYLSNHPKKLLTSYLMDYVLPEVHHEANIRNKQGFSKFIHSLEFCHGQMLNFTNISRDCGIDAKTVRSYFDILEDMYLGYYVHPYRKRGRRQTIQETPKFYLMDTGLANYITRFEFTEWRGEAAGRAFEHYIYLELRAYIMMKEKRTDITYWRTKTGHEVDFVLEDGRIAIETKISNPAQKRDLQGLILFGQEHGAKLHVVGLEPQKRLMTIEDQEIIVWPVEEFLKALWNNEIIEFYNF